MRSTFSRCINIRIRTCTVDTIRLQSAVPYQFSTSAIPSSKILFAKHRRAFNQCHAHPLLVKFENKKNPRQIFSYTALVFSTHIQEGVSRSAAYNVYLFQPHQDTATLRPIDVHEVYAHARVTAALFVSCMRVGGTGRPRCFSYIYSGIFSSFQREGAEMGLMGVGEERFFWWKGRCILSLEYEVCLLLTFY